jgi:hypothetical protein
MQWILELLVWDCWTTFEQFQLAVAIDLLDFSDNLLCISVKTKIMLGQNWWNFCKKIETISQSSLIPHTKSTFPGEGQIYKSISCQEHTIRTIVTSTVLVHIYLSYVCFTWSMPQYALSTPNSSTSGLLCDENYRGTAFVVIPCTQPVTWIEQ